MPPLPTTTFYLQPLSIDVVNEGNDEVQGPFQLSMVFYTFGKNYFFSKTPFKIRKMFCSDKILYTFSNK